MFFDDPVAVDLARNVLWALETNGADVTRLRTFELAEDFAASSETSAKTASKISSKISSKTGALGLGPQAVHQADRSELGELLESDWVVEHIWPLPEPSKPSSDVSKTTKTSRQISVKSVPSVVLGLRSQHDGREYALPLGTSGRGESLSPHMKPLGPFDILGFSDPSNDTPNTLVGIRLPNALTADANRGAHGGDKVPAEIRTHRFALPQMTPLGVRRLSLVSQGGFPGETRIKTQSLRRAGTKNFLTPGNPLEPIGFLTTSNGGPDLLLALQHGGYDPRRDIKTPDQLALIDVWQRQVVKSMPIRDHFAWAKIRNHLAGSNDRLALLRAFPRVDAVKNAFTVMTPPDRQHSLRLNVPLSDYQTSTFRLETTTGQWRFGLLTDPLNPAALARKRQDPVFLDVFIVNKTENMAEDSSPRVRVPVGVAPVSWHSEGPVLVVKRKHRHFSRGARSIELYRLP